MAKFTVGNTLDKMIDTIEDFAMNDEIAKECIREGEKIMKKEIQSGASQHIKTGKMANSLVETTPMLQDGTWVGRIRFAGVDKEYVNEEGKKVEITNWLKAYRIEYGTSKQKAKPFVRKAVKRSGSQISNKWQEIYDRELRKLQ